MPITTLAYAVGTTLPFRETTLTKSPSLTLGWREWASLPQLGLPAIKAKIDTGAKTSALHAFKVEPFTTHGQDMVRFWVHPIQLQETTVVECCAPVLDQREVSDSGGHKELRYVIESLVTIGNSSWAIELTLTNRDSMRFRMLLGRQAMAEGKCLVNPSARFLHGDLDPTPLYKPNPSGDSV